MRFSPKYIKFLCEEIIASRLPFNISRNADENLVCASFATMHVIYFRFFGAFN